VGEDELVEDEGKTKIREKSMEDSPVSANGSSHVKEQTSKKLKVYIKEGHN
jgi:hypothetical protein